MKTLVLIALAGLAAQLVDGGLGMGFGVTSTTLLIALASLGPAQASAVVHSAQVGTTLVSALSHWKFGNVNWRNVVALGVPGSIGAFAGATFLSHISTQAAAPFTSLLLALIGIYLLFRFSRGTVFRVSDCRVHSQGFLGALGLVGGFVDASGGGGWGPVTASTLLGLGKTEPRKVVGTVDTAEFFVSVAATLGFVVGLWSDLVENIAAVVALLIGGTIAAPVGAWLVSKANPTVLGGAVGTLVMVLNLPKVLDLVNLQVFGVWPLQLGLTVGGIALTVIGFQRSQAKRVEEHMSLQKRRDPTKVQFWV